MLASAGLPKQDVADASNGRAAFADRWMWMPGGNRIGQADAELSA